MLVIRFKVKCQPGKVDDAIAVFSPVVAASRAIDGVVHFDIASDLTDSDSIIATEVFEDKAARDRQEALPEVANVMSALPQIIAAPPEATVFNVASSEPAM